MEEKERKKDIKSEVQKVIEFMNDLQDFYIGTTDEKTIRALKGDYRTKTIFVQNLEINTSNGTKKISGNLLEPNISGVYYIYNKKNKLYYIGEGADVLSRLKTHFNGKEIFVEKNDVMSYKVKVYPVNDKDNKLYRLMIEGISYIIARDCDNIECEDKLFEFNTDDKTKNK